MRRQVKIAAGLILLAAGLAALTATWVLVLASEATPEGTLSQILAWPVACTTRGCITTHDWGQQFRLAQAFADSVKKEAPSKEAALTTSVRRHLVENLVVGKPVTASDARRYREEILHLKDEHLLQEAAGASFEEYDELVVLPFLQQAALQQQRKAETLDELYATLAQERAVFILPFHYQWDKDTGRVVRR